MVGAFGENTHLLKGKADFPADIFPSVVGGDIHIGGLVIRSFGGLSVFIQMKKIEFLLRAEVEMITALCRVRNRPFEKASGIAFKRSSVRIRDIRKHPDNLSVFRSPGEEGEGIGLRVKEQIAVLLVAESGDGGSVEGDSVFESPGKLARHDGYIFLYSEHIAESKTDEFHVLLRYILHDFLF